MAREIERKFLLASEDWRAAVQHRTELCDGIIALGDGRKVRLRFYDDSKVTLSLKGPRTGMSRDEFEYPIPYEDGQAMLAAHFGGPTICKTRHHVMHAGQRWTVDEYRGVLSGIVIAEIELASEAADFTRPPWLGTEVTFDKSYRQSSLLRHRMAALADSA